MHNSGFVCKIIKRVLNGNTCKFGVIFIVLRRFNKTIVISWIIKNTKAYKIILCLKYLIKIKRIN